MSKYLGLFVAEAVEHLEALGQDLVALEREQTPATVDSLFRHAHSVKGMAASMGFETIARLAHRVEDIVEAFRKDATALTRERVDLLLSAADTLLVQVHATAEGRTVEPPEALLGRLSEAVAALTGREPEPTRVAQAVVQLPAQRARPAALASLSVAPAASGVTAPPAADPARTVRVRTELLDDFLETAGELLLATARIREIGRRVPDAQRPLLEEGVDRLHALVKDLHGKVMGARMTPVALLTDRFPRAVRDIARRRGREVELSVSGAEIELDRAILDELADPLLHVLRNAVDHGIEDAVVRTASGKPAAGQVTLTVRRTRDRVIVEIEDDGRGMDGDRLTAVAVARGQLTPEAARRLSERERLLLCCLPGISTASDVNEISGRGVGMDAVKRSVEGLGGSLDLDSEVGRGTRVSLRLPLTVAVVQLLLVRAGTEVVGLPIAKVAGAVELPHTALQRSGPLPLLPHGKALLRVYELSTLLQLPEAAARAVRPYVVMDGEEGQVALAVDALLGQEEVVLKALSRPLDRIAGLSGVTILGTGRPVFILDVPRLLDRP